MAINPKNMKIAMGAIGAIGPVAASASNQMGANGPAGPAPKAPPRFGDLRTTSTGDLEIYTQAGWQPSQGPTFGMASIPSQGMVSGQITNGDYSIATATNAKTLAVETQYGRVTVNYDTGELTMPAGMGREKAIREFWLGFQENFKSSNTEKYERQIIGLERELASVKNASVLMRQENEKEASKRVAEKVKKKYGNEKFIMIKPDDLIKFIEGA